MFPLSKSAFALRLSNNSHHSVQYKNIYSKHLSFSSSSVLSSNPKIIKKENMFYSLYKIFIISTDDKIIDNIISNNDETAFSFYYPIKPVNSLHYLIRIANQNKDKDNYSNVTLCNCLKDICFEICKFAALDTDRYSYKINLYDKEYHPIKNDFQLTLYSPLSEFYAKVKIISKDIRDMNSINSDNIYNSNTIINSEWINIQRNSSQKQTNYTSLKLTSYLCSIKKFQHKPQSKQNIISNNSKSNSQCFKDSLSKIMQSGQTSRDYSIKSLSQKNMFRKKVLMTRKNRSFGKKSKKRNEDIKMYCNKKSTNNSNLNVNSMEQETDTNDLDYNFKSFMSSKPIKPNTTTVLCNNNISRNSSLNLYASINNVQTKRQINTNRLSSAFIQNISKLQNNYTPMYIEYKNNMYKYNNHINKSYQHIQSQIKKVKIKHLDIKRNNYCINKNIYSYHSSQNNTHPTPYSPLSPKIQDPSTQINLNKKLFKQLNTAINKLIITNTNTFLTDGELKLFPDMTCNYILTNELSTFPIITLRKEYLIWVFFSNYINANYYELCKRFYINMRTHLDSFDFLFQDEECETFLKGVIGVYNKIKKDRLYFLNNVKGETGNKLSISYMVFVLFMILNEKNIDYVSVEISLLIMQSMNVQYGHSLTFQDYCNVNLYLKRVENLSKNKQFYLLKEILNGIYNNDCELDNKQKIKSLFGFNQYICNVLLTHDLITIHKDDNIDIKFVFKEIERIYYTILLYFNPMNISAS